MAKRLTQRPPLIQRIVDRIEDIGEVEAEHPEGDEAGERDQCRDQAIFDRGGAALVGAQIRSGHGCSRWCRARWSPRCG